MNGKTLSEFEKLSVKKLATNPFTKMSKSCSCNEITLLTLKDNEHVCLINLSNEAGTFYSVFIRSETV